MKYFSPKFTLTLLILLFCGMVNAATYWRFDTRSPAQIAAAGGFRAQGSDRNLLAHSVNDHPRSPPYDASAYIAFTTLTARRGVATEFWNSGQSDMWLYEVNINGNLPNLANNLYMQLEVTVQALLALEPRLVGHIDMADFQSDASYEEMRDRFSDIAAGNESLEVVFGSLSSLYGSYQVARDQDEYVGVNFVPFSAVRNAFQVQVNGTEPNGYTVRQSISYTPTPAAPPAAPTAENRTVFLDADSLTDRARELLEEPQYNMAFCSFSSNGLLLRSTRAVVSKCPLYADRKAEKSSLYAPPLKLGRIKNSKIDYGSENRAWVDFNGDGVPDFCATRSDGVNGVQCNLNLKSFPYESFKLAKMELDDLGWASGGRAWVDVNGDGKADYCRVVYYKTQLRCSISTGIDFKKDGDFLSEYLDAGYAQTRHWLDVNSDGKFDFCRLTGDGMKCKLGGSSGFGDEWSFTSGDYGWSPTQAWVDIDGNGFPDFCRQVYSAGTTMRCNLNLGNNKWQEVEQGNQPYPINISQQWYPRMQGHLSQSYCRTYPSASTLTCTHYNQRTKNFEGKSYKLPVGVSFSGDLTLVDINNDGLADVCAASSSSLICSVFAGYDRGFVQKSISFNTQSFGSDTFYSLKKTILSKRTHEDNPQFCRAVNYGYTYCNDFMLDKKPNISLR